MSYSQVENKRQNEKLFLAHKSIEYPTKHI